MISLCWAAPCTVDGERRQALGVSFNLCSEALHAVRSLVALMPVSSQVCGQSLVEAEYRCPGAAAPVVFQASSAAGGFSFGSAAAAAPAIAPAASGLSS